MKPGLKKKLREQFNKHFIKAIVVLEIILFAYLISNPLFQLVPQEVDFYVDSEQTKFRAGYSISFSWDISVPPAQANIIWGDGTIEELKDHEQILHGSIEHVYALQGRYSPTFLVWDAKFTS